MIADLKSTVKVRGWSITTIDEQSRQNAETIQLILKHLNLEVTKNEPFSLTPVEEEKETEHKS